MTHHVFSSSSIFIVVDIDECSAKSHDCDPLATCINTNGSFKCDCNEGYTGDGKSCSGKFEDLGVDELLEKTCGTKIGLQLKTSNYKTNNHINKEIIH